MKIMAANSTNYNQNQSSKLKVSKNNLAFGMKIVFENPEKEVFKEILRKRSGTNVQKLNALEHVLDMITDVNKSIDALFTTIVNNAVKELGIFEKKKPGDLIENYNNKKIKLELSIDRSDDSCGLEEKLKVSIKDDLINKNNSVVPVHANKKLTSSRIYLEDFIDPGNNVLTEAIKSTLEQFADTLLKNSKKYKDYIEKQNVLAKAKFDKL